MLSLLWVLVLVLRPVPLAHKHPPVLIPSASLEATSEILSPPNISAASPSVNDRLPLPLPPELAQSLRLQEHALRNAPTVKLPLRPASIPLPALYTPPPKTFLEHWASPEVILQMILLVMTPTPTLTPPTPPTQRMLTLRSSSQTWPRQSKP